MDSDVAFTADSPLLAKAYAFADEAHSGQREETDGSPYIEHPVAVARLLHEAGFDEAVVAAGLLHDTVEATDVDIQDIRHRFGDDVAELVAAMTEPADVEPYEARKAAHRAQIRAAGRRAEAIFAADKIAKASRLRAAIAVQGEEQVGLRMEKPLDKKVEHYQASLALLEDVAASLPLVPRLRGELARLGESRARADHLALGRRAVEAVNRRDAQALIALCTPEVEWYPAITLGAGGGPYRGHAGIERYIEDLGRSWEELSIELRDLGHEGERVVALCELTARGRRSGRVLRSALAVVYEVEGSLISRARSFVADRAWDQFAAVSAPR